MKILRFLKGFFFFTGSMIIGWAKNLKFLWTDVDCFWAVNEVFFRGNLARERRDQYILDQKRIVEKADKLFTI